MMLRFRSMSATHADYAGIGMSAGDRNCLHNASTTSDAGDSHWKSGERL
jgi:hypothetical protein